MIVELAGLLTDERPLRTAWLIRPRGARRRGSLLVGTASCLPWRFRGALRRHIGAARAVLLGGPLDGESIGRALAAGSSDPVGSLQAVLAPRVRARLYRLLGIDLLPSEAHQLYGQALFGRPDQWLESELRALKPWRAFLGLWTRYCADKGGGYNIEMDAAELAAAAGKGVHPLQSLEEQIAYLEAIPVRRIVQFIEHADWDRHRREYARAYVAGDCERLLACARQFPMYDEDLIAKRAALLAERMAPHLDQGGACVFLGVSHCACLVERLRDAGFEARFSGLLRSPALAASA